jgi:hypothetical protein
MQRKWTFTFLMIAAVVVAAAAVPALAQEGGAPPEMTPEQQAEMEAYMKAGALGPQHEAMAKEVGTYDVAMKNFDNPDGTPTESTGVATRSLMFGGRVLVEDFESDFMGMPFTGRGMNGFDNVSGKYWSTWMDSMSTGLMVSEGTCDASHACEFVGSYNDPIANGPKKMRVVTRWTSPTTQVFEMHGAGRDGKEMKMMEMTYTKR